MKKGNKKIQSESSTLKKKSKQYTIEELLELGIKTNKIEITPSKLKKIEDENNISD